MSVLAVPVHGWVQLFVLILLTLLVAKPLGKAMALIWSGEAFSPSSFLGKIETLFLNLCGPSARVEMNWKAYAKSVLVFSFFGMVALFFLVLTLSPMPVSVDEAFNIAVSFTTNTNWQSYNPETATGLAIKMMGVTVQHFLAASTGLCVFLALVRGLTRSKSETIGNFWKDMIRTCLFILLPLAVLFALVLITQGAVQNFQTVLATFPLEAGGEQSLRMGPVASEVAIKQLGSNGGGYFLANAAHPFENPTPLSNYLQCLAMLLIPAALPFAFGRMSGQPRQGTMLLKAILILFIPLALATMAFESANPTAMEGKEVRLGVVGSSLWSAIATATATGSTNAAMDSFAPLGSLVPLVLIQLGEVVFGGVGSGLYGLFVFVFLTVFMAGLMIGRTPEFLGKKISVFEMKMVSLFILIPAATTLLGAALATLTGASGAVGNPGAQGFSEILYAFSSASNNNGSALGGLDASSAFYNVMLGLCMLAGRFGLMLTILAIAGSLAAKVTVPPSKGTLDTSTPLFVIMLVVVIVLIGFVTYVPALMLGPVQEHFHMIAMGAA